MVKPRVYQGSWDELLEHVDEFKNVDDLLLIVPSTNGVENGIREPELTLADTLVGMTGLVSYEPANLSKNVSKEFTKLVVAKSENKRK